MSVIDNYERQFSIMDQLQKDFGNLATPENRNKLNSLIKYCTDETKKFTRIDKNKQVHLHYHDPEQLSVSDIVIGLSDDNKFIIDTWTMWKLMHGLQEEI